jgi:hypothetical protein
MKFHVGEKIFTALPNLEDFETFHTYKKAYEQAAYLRVVPDLALANPKAFWKQAIMREIGKNPKVIYNFITSFLCFKLFLIY